ncbi:MAG TPA: hypothetical protein VFG55_00885 [Rhodanobacteraceae bacterium]|nr:hypothetical protein [Rhodanobacteraceae bacterium]
MPLLRHTEVNVLGYRIQRVEESDQLGPIARWYEVLAPASDQVIGSFAGRPAAERHIIRLELSSLYRPDGNALRRAPATSDRSPQLGRCP